MTQQFREELQFWRGVNLYQWGKVEDAEAELGCAYLNGAEKLFDQVDSKYLELVDIEEE